MEDKASHAEYGYKCIDKEADGELFRQEEGASEEGRDGPEQWRTHAGYNDGCV